MWVRVMLFDFFSFCLPGAEPPTHYTHTHTLLHTILHSFITTCSIISSAPAIAAAVPIPLCKALEGSREAFVIIASLDALLGSHPLTQSYTHTLLTHRRARARSHPPTHPHTLCLSVCLSLSLCVFVCITMAVEADNPHNSLLGVFNNRQVHLSTMDLYAPADLRSAGVGSNTACFLPLYQSLDSYQQLSNRTLTPAAACNPAPAPALVPTFQQQATPVTILHTARPAHHSRKRKVPSDNMHAPSQPLLKPVHMAALNCVDLNRTQSSLSPPGHNIVSTGLRLASFDDDGSTVTSSRLDTGSVCVSDEVTAQLLNQQNELRQLFKTHVEQLQQALKERTQSHSQALLVSVEDKMSRRLRDKDAELGRVNRHNSELEERIKHLSLETHMWQSKARSYEAMVTVLRANLQQAIMHQSREQGRLEGCGDSDADDAASAYIDENMDAQQNRALMMRASKAQFLRACKRCQAKEVTILILPCMHLCLCRDCKAADVERCPVCNTLKSAFIEVYLS